MQRAGIMVRTRCVSPPRPEHACCSHSQHLRPTANISQQWFWRTFLVQLHVTVKTSPACTIMDGLLLWRGWEIIFRMRRESTALVLLLAGVTSQVLFIFGVLYFNTNSEFQCHTKKKDILCAKARPSKCPFNLCFYIMAWECPNMPKLGHFGHN